MLYKLTLDKLNGSMKILVTGGCGYIGSHTIVDLIQKGYEVISVDNYLNSESEVLQHIKRLTGKDIIAFATDLTNLEETKNIFKAHPDIKGIIHFAALKSVGESTKIPLQYFRNNVGSMLNILECQKEWNIPHFVFSSSCSVYGNPDSLPVTEDTPLKEAESPYARTKQIGEQIIQDFAKANPTLNFILLRYFNPAGIHSSGILKEKAKREVETLVPIIEEVYRGQRDKLIINGGDYPTRDGTCIRDYIHIEDLAEAHTLAIDFLVKNEGQGKLETYNLGTGQGVTILEMIKAMEKVSSTKLNYEIGPKRDGDVIQVFADSAKAKQELGWLPKKGIEDIFKSVL